MEKTIKKILFTLIIIGLFLPLIQYQTRLVIVKGLHGSFDKTSFSEFSIKNWFNNSFQDGYDAYFNQNFGFRAPFVRLHNQLDYSLFGETNANSVIVGKEGYLYEKNYIKSYLGDDFIGQSQIEQKVKTIDSIRRVLKEHQTELLIIIAPGKGYFYPEYIPDSMLKPRGKTNYESYIKALSNSEIPYIDFNDLFLKMKDTASIVIYPKTGIHWSQGILPYVMDSIIKKIESDLDKNLKNIKWEYTNPISKADKQDADIEKGLNLILPLSIPPMSYPKHHFEQGKYFDKPKVISIADSFWWQIFNTGISKNVFNKGEFWYYYKQIYPDQFTREAKVSDINTKKELFEADLVVLMATDANLYKFPYGFTKALNNPKIGSITFEKEIQNLITIIRSDKKWFAKVQEKAKTRGITVDSMLYLDAKYIIDTKSK